MTLEQKIDLLLEQNNEILKTLEKHGLRQVPTPARESESEIQNDLLRRVSTTSDPTEIRALIDSANRKRMALQRPVRGAHGQ